MSDHWSRRDRDRFDAILERVIAALPRRLLELLDEAPLVVEDAPTDALLESLGLDPQVDDLCGLHSGASIMERSVSHSGELPERMEIFRRGILDAAGGWDDAAIEEEIRITILHEIGHHFGLSEEDLERLGYG